MRACYVSACDCIAKWDLHPTLIRGVPHFPIEQVLFAIAVGAFIIALVRPVIRGDDGQDAVPRRCAVGVAGAALVCAVTMTLLVRV